uniref:Uncharacterized protein n=1 Tax=Peronospora matthiolae TaxID=2874970 RepID=A0AAV1TUA1_9STRA
MQMHHSAMPRLSCYNLNKCGIRSGMSVQELKYLTAQRQRREFWACMSTLQLAVATDDTSTYSPPSTRSSSSSSLSASPPPCYYRDGACYSEIYGCAPLSNRRGLASDKMYVTRGGQVISLLAGVVNAPSGDV